MRGVGHLAGSVSHTPHLRRSHATLSAPLSPLATLRRARSQILPACDLAAASWLLTAANIAAELGWLLLDAAYRTACSVVTAPNGAGLTVGVAFNPYCSKSARLFIITPPNYLSDGGTRAPIRQIMAIMTVAWR